MFNTGTFPEPMAADKLRVLSNQLSKHIEFMMKSCTQVLTFEKLRHFFDIFA